MKTRIYNFGAGPAMLPEPVLKSAQEEFLNWHNTGMSILELGHRTPEVIQLLRDAEQSLRELIQIPDHYKVLFLGGAARTQFSMIPLNFLQTHEQAGYLISGIWSQLAYAEATHLKQAYCVASSEASQFRSLPKQNSWNLNKDTAYLYYTPNETINGIRFPYVPQTNGIPLIADMTSCLLSEPIRVNDYGLIFAGAQKNIANAGLTVVIIRDDLLLKNKTESIPTMLDYNIHAEHHSLYATPPVFNCYLAAKMFDWIKQQGGVMSLYQQNCAKAAKLYSFIDNSAFYTAAVEPEARSLMNVCFSINKPQLEETFLRLAETRGLTALRGHRLTGGIRASIYNAMPMDGVDALLEFMAEFSEGKIQ